MNYGLLFLLGSSRRGSPSSSPPPALPPDAHRLFILAVITLGSGGVILKEKLMISMKLKTALVAAAAMILTATAGQAAILPAPGSAYSSPDIQLAYCAAGLRLGPLGACIAGGPGPGPGWRGPGWRRHCWINRWGNRVCN